MKGGIYIIRNLVSMKAYVGSARDITARWKRHRRALTSGRHHSYKLQSAWDKYGAAAFEFVAVEMVAEADLLDREQVWIDATKAVRHGYNVCPVAGSSLGAKQSEATRAKLSSRVASQETRERMAAAHRGRKHSAETRAKIGASHRGKTVSEETRKRLSDANKNPSSETRRKQSAAAKNRTPEHRARLAAASTGRTHGPEARAKLSAAFKGRIVSEETRRRMSVAAKAAIARRKSATGAGL